MIVSVVVRCVCVPFPPRTAPKKDLATVGGVSDGPPVTVSVAVRTALQFPTLSRMRTLRVWGPNASNPVAALIPLVPVKAVAALASNQYSPALARPLPPLSAAPTTAKAIDAVPGAIEPGVSVTLVNVGTVLSTV